MMILNQIIIKIKLKVSLKIRIKQKIIKKITIKRNSLVSHSIIYNEVFLKMLNSQMI